MTYIRIDLEDNVCEFGPWLLANCGNDGKWP